MYVCVCVCVCECVRACVRARVCVCECSSALLIFNHWSWLACCISHRLPLSLLVLMMVMQMVVVMTIMTIVMTWWQQCSSFCPIVFCFLLLLVLSFSWSACFGSELVLSSLFREEINSLCGVLWQPVLLVSVQLITVASCFCTTDNHCLLFLCSRGAV